MTAATSAAGCLDFAQHRLPQRAVGITIAMPQLVSCREAFRDAAGGFLRQRGGFSQT